LINLKKNKQVKKNDPKNPIHTKEKDNSFSDLLVDLDISDIDQNKTPSKQKKAITKLKQGFNNQEKYLKKKEKEGQIINGVTNFYPKGLFTD